MSVDRDERYPMAEGMSPKLTAVTCDGRLTVQVEYDSAVQGLERASEVIRRSSEAA
ncbi:hypothetical protein [Streptomyces telluris]|uniref:Uncharacterized protein n=1 Tax=Streptomyces telluris TaxID=2720021 RepID=A0A9X2LHF8_9ACTN|nr:hypothetical protein [Streptomyces telluris]MCQ8771379.1 hypothetical protein [Streptomyces telluris]NJP77316.1 hypothetical protein [Streptomyces telluris]